MDSKTETQAATSPTSDTQKLKDMLTFLQSKYTNAAADMSIEEKKKHRDMLHSR